MDTDRDVERGMTRDPKDVITAWDTVVRRLTSFAFPALDEDHLQAQVFKCLDKLEPVLLGMGIDQSITPQREVRGGRGRYDIFVTAHNETHDLASLVLELKVKGSEDAVLRQAQKYALTDGVDLIAIVTTSARLNASLTRNQPSTLGGKPFRVLLLRTF